MTQPDENAVQKNGPSPDENVVQKNCPSPDENACIIC